MCTVSVCNIKIDATLGCQNFGLHREEEGVAVMHTLLLVGQCTAGKSTPNQMVKPQTYTTLALPDICDAAVHCWPKWLIPCCISLAT